MRLGFKTVKVGLHEVDAAALRVSGIQRVVSASEITRLDKVET